MIQKKEMAPSDSAQTTLKLTIPWEPELQTARRARLVGYALSQSDIKFVKIAKVIHYVV